MDIYETVTARIVAALETARDWHKPWTSAFSGEQGGTLLRPINCRTGKGYRGINVPLLWGARRSSPHWGTYRAWAELGAQVRKGERATHIVFWKQIARRAEAGSEDDPGKYLLARGYAVFNAEQVEGWNAPAAPASAPIAPAAPAAAFEPHAAADAFVAATRADIRHGGDRAFYSPAFDRIQLPDRAAFRGSESSSAREAYYSTLFHELTHWTGAEKRCNRDFRGRFGDESYAAEELVAELGAAFLAADLMLLFEPRADHAAYIANWLRILKGDKRAIFTAASKAEQACRFLAGLGEEEEEEDAPAIAAE